MLVLNTIQCLHNYDNMCVYLSHTLSVNESVSNYCNILDCAAVDCGPLSDPLNGSVDINQTVFESIVTYTCDTGYVLDGADTRICQANGMWSGTEPSCASKTYSIYMIQLCTM